MSSSKMPQRRRDPVKRSLAAVIAGWLVLSAVPTRLAAADTSLSWESQFRFGIVGNANFTDGPMDLGSVKALDYRFRAVASLPAGSNFLLRGGVDFAQTRFDAPISAHVPDVLQTASVVVGVDVQIGEAWIFRRGQRDGTRSLAMDRSRPTRGTGAGGDDEAGRRLPLGAARDVNPVP